VVCGSSSFLPAKVGAHSVCVNAQHIRFCKRPVKGAARSCFHLPLRLAKRLSGGPSASRIDTNLSGGGSESRRLEVFRTTFRGFVGNSEHGTCGFTNWVSSVVLSFYTGGDSGCLGSGLRVVHSARPQSPPRWLEHRGSPTGPGQPTVVRLASRNKEKGKSVAREINIQRTLG
jgi:hypothetical protein